MSLLEFMSDSPFLSAFIAFLIVGCIIDVANAFSRKCSCKKVKENETN